MSQMCVDNRLILHNYGYQFIIFAIVRTI